MSDAILDALSPGYKTKSPLPRQAFFDDYEQIAAVQTANGLSAKPHAEWLHLWQNNPAYDQLSGWPIGWVLEDETGRLVGSLENVPCLYRFRGRTFIGAFGRGWAVDARYRAYSLLLLMRQLKQPGVDLRVTNTANKRTSAVLIERGWLRTPAGKWNQSALWVASYAQLLQGCLLPMVSPVLSQFNRWLRSSFLRTTSLADSAIRLENGLELQWTTSFDERFDVFWTELERRNPEVLLSVRSRRTLDWHYSYGLRQNRIWILTASDRSRLVAYAIFERKEAQSVDLAKMMLIDFQSVVGDPELCSAMISRALKRCRRAFVPVLENAGCWLDAMQPGAKRTRFRRDFGGWCYLYHTVNPELASALLAPQSWCPTQYDADASL